MALCEAGFEKVCWTRMQTEAGEGLSRIVRRKEMERRAGSGLFFWGVGSAPSRAIPGLAKAAAVIDVLFSVMKSKPKTCDVEPAALLAWNGYVDTNGVVRAIPRNVLVTSRATSRNHHYALICHSDVALAVSDEGPFDPGAFRNYGAGKSVGASQVTALLERYAADGSADYRVAMRARLTGALWVKLVEPVELSSASREWLAAEPFDEDDWVGIVDTVRRAGRHRLDVRSKVEPSLFAV